MLLGDEQIFERRVCSRVCMADWIDFYSGQFVDSLARFVAFRHHDASRVGGLIPGLGNFNTVTCPFQLHVLQSFLRIQLIVHIAISVPPGTLFHLSPVKHLTVKCLAQGHIIGAMFSRGDGPRHDGFELNRGRGTAHTAAHRSGVTWALCHLFSLLYRTHTYKNMSLYFHFGLYSKH